MDKHKISISHLIADKLIFLFLIVFLNLSAVSQTLNLDSVFTAEEITWLNKNKDGIRYAPNPSWPPGDYVEDGIHKGFVSDYIKLFEEMLGINFNKVYYQNWTEVLNGLKNSEVDFVGAIQQTYDREDYLLFTESFRIIQLGIITRENYHHELTREHINSMSLACLRNYTSTQYISREFPGAHIDLVDFDLEALFQASYGIVDGAVVDFMTASYLVEKYGISNLKGAALLDFSWELRLASRNELPEFNSILNKLLKNINEEQHKEIFNKWVNINFIAKPHFFQRYQKTIIGIVVFILVLLIVVFVFNFSLRKQIEKQTFLLKKARDIARRNVKNYKLIAENTSDVVWLSDLNFNTSYISPSVEKMFGGKVDDHMKKSIEEKIPSKYVENLKSILHEELENEKIPDCNKDRSRVLELKHYCTDGSTIWVEMNVSFVRNIEGKPIGLHGISRNITENIKTRKYIERRLAMEKLLSNISRIAVGNSNINDTLKKIVKKAGSVLNVSRVYIFEHVNQNDTVSNSFEWCAKDVTPQIDKLQQQPCNEFSWFFDKLKQGRVIKYKNIGKIPDEPTRNILQLQGIISVLIVPLTLNDRFYGFIGFDECRTARSWDAEDVKVLQSLAYIVASLIERNKTERELRIKNRSIELSLVGKAMSDLEGKITYANQTFLNYWRYQNVEEVLNKTVYDFWESSYESSKIVNAIHEKGSWGGERKGIRSDGSVFDVLVQASLVTSKEGKPLCMQASFFDISERKIWEKELIHAKEKAEESSRLKSAFLANMSHEIRTPMNGIIGFLNLLEEVDFTTEEKKELVHIVNESGKRLINTINDIIESSIIEVGEIAINVDEINLSELMSKTYKHFKPEADKKNLLIKINNKAEKLLIETDKNKLERILHELINNALKFAEKGSIEFGAELQESFVYFHVKDTGTGIWETQIEKIFHPFTQADMSLSRKHEGSGLGLYISKAYVEQLGGKIWINSIKNEGSSFFFTIPYNPVILSNAETKEKGKLNKDNFLAGQKILVAEDDPNSFHLLELSLKRFGAEIIHTVTGEDTIQSLLDNPDISLILMDIKMPGMNGLEVTRIIRNFNNDIPIIAQTAFAFLGDKKKAIEAGCNEYISKPINRNLLLQKIEQLLN